MIEFWQYNHLSPCNWQGAQVARSSRSQDC